MSEFLFRALTGKNNKASGVMAISIIALIGMGCMCGKDFLANVGTETNSSRTDSNGSNTPPFSSSPTTDSTPARTVTKSDASKGQLPADDELQQMAKTTLLDFNDALQQEDFTSFHSKICKPWQKQTSPESLKSTFQGFIDKGISIASIISLEAEFSPSPEIGREVGYKTLKLQGEYKTSPNLTKFELNYIPEGKDWKLSKIVVDTTQSNN